MLAPTLSRSRRLRPLFLVAVIAAAGCADTSADQASAPTDAVAADQAPARAAVVRAAQTEPSSDTIMAPPEDFEQLRVELERLLGLHAMLDIRSARGELDESPEFVDDAVESLNGNTDELTAFARSVATEDLAQEFEQLWFDHVQDVLAYAQAVNEGDDAAAEEAEARLDEYRDYFARRLSEVTEGRIPQDQLAAGIGTHLDAMLRQIDAYASEDFASAYELQREAYRQMSPLAAGVAAAFAGAAPGDEMTAPDDLLARGPEEELAAQLRVLFGEHAALTVDAVRAAIRGTGDFTAATDALGQTTDALTATVETLFGPEQAETFKTAWGRHVELYVDYAAAAAEGDEAAQQELRAQRVPEMKEQTAAMFSAATGGQLPQEDLTGIIDGFTGPLLDQIDAYASEDYGTANELANQTYNHLFTAAAEIATAFEEAGLIPVGGAQTGAGGLAREG